MHVVALCTLLFGVYHSIRALNVIDFEIDGLPNKFYPNVSLGLSPDLKDCHWKQWRSDHVEGYNMSYTPNRRDQSATIIDAEKQRMQLGIILAVGGHSDTHYDYGPLGSVNGLMAVWDSWLEYFFTQSSNTTSLVLLFDERDYKRQKYSTSKHSYLDNIVIDNMGAQPVDCVHFRSRPGASLESVYAHHDRMNHKLASVTGESVGPVTSALAGDILKGTNQRSAGPVTSAAELFLRHRRRPVHALNAAKRKPAAGGKRSHSKHTPSLGSDSPTLAGGTGASLIAQQQEGLGAEGISKNDIHHRQGCSNELQLDQHYRVYYIDVAHRESPHQQPLIIFASVHNFPVPEWAKDKDEEELFKSWKPNRLNKRYPTNYAYVKMTNWYAYYMTNLEILDFFDYGGKLDNDVSFVAPFPEPNLPLRLARNNSQMLVTQREWYQDDTRIAMGVELCLDHYVTEESKKCQGKLLTPSGKRDPTFWSGNLQTTFRAHFLTYWLGLYTAPETRHMAKYWNYFHPWGMWDFRWGDQQWWPRPISMLGSGDVSKDIDVFDLIDTENGNYVVHKLWPRYGTVPKASYFNQSGSTRESRDALYKEASKPFIY